MNDMNLGKRIAQRLKELGWQRNDLIDRVPGLSAQTLSALILRDSKRSEFDVGIAKALGVQLSWLNSGLGEKLLRENGSVTASEVVLIPLSEHTSESSLACILPVNEGLSINRAWVNVTFPEMQPDADLFVIPARGYSMAPTFGAGDLLLADKSVNRVHEDGVYVTRLGDSVRIKRLQERPDGSMLMLSDNPKYEPNIIPPDNLDRLQILGRVLYVWTGKRL